ncbi:MAG: hypothetical protein AAFO91_14350 [Bacteroidota bacterium]
MPFAALPFYQTLEEQAAMRYDALPLLCPTQQPISWQIETNEYDDNGFPKTDIVSADGQFF